MTLEGLIGQRLPRPRTSDGLTEDHPARPWPHPQPLRNSAWLRALAFLGVMVVAILLGASIYLAVTKQYAVPADSWAPAWAELIAAVVAFVVLAFVMEERIWPYEIAPDRAAGLLRGLALGLILVCVCVGLLSLVGAYRVRGVNWAYDPWSALFITGLVAAVAEEIIFRGVLFRLVEEGLGSWGATAISGLVFGLAHLSNPDASWWGAIAIAIEAGILFAALYILTRSLWWCIGLHFAWNIIQGPVFGSIVSGSGRRDSWLISDWSGPEWLTGGAFGLEASVVPVILLGVLGAAILAIAQDRGLMVAPLWRRHRLSLKPAATNPDPAR